MTNTKGKFKGVFYPLEMEADRHTIHALNVTLLCQLSAASLKYLSAPVIWYFVNLVPKYSRLARTLS